jgi:hypothetical protein
MTRKMTDIPFEFFKLTAFKDFAPPARKNKKQD